MKNFKRLSILLLSVVMVFSCFAVLALAEEDQEAEKIAAVEALLEYYDEEGVYVCDPMDGVASEGALSIDPNSLGEYAIVDGRTVWTATLDGENVLCTDDIVLPGAYQSFGLVYAFRVDADAQNEDKGYLALEFSGASTSLGQTDAQSILVLDYKEGKAYFAAMDADTVVSAYEIEGFVPENGVWYTVAALYNKRSNTIEGTITAEGGAAVPFSYRFNGMSALATMTLRSRNLGNDGVTVSWDLFELYEGSFIRSNLPGERQAYIDEVILAYMKEYDGASDNLRRVIVSVVDELFALGYVPTPGSETEAFVNEEFNKEMVDYYWQQFSEGVAAIDKTQKYKVRYEHILATKAEGEAFPEKPVGYPKEMYDAVIAAYQQELADLAVIAQYSEELLKAVEADTATMDYQQLLAWILDFEEKRENLHRADGSYDDTYNGVFVAVELYQEAVDRLYALKVLALDYISAVDAMNKNYPTDFGVKYNAYTRARTIAADPEFKYIAQSYNASFVFLGNDKVLYDNREFEIDGYSEDGKTAYLSINALPYTVTLSNHRLTLVGEGLTIVLEPADDLNSGLALEGNWKSEKSLAEAGVDFDNRDDFIIAGEAACKNYIAAIDAALVTKGYYARVEKRDGVKDAYDAIRADFEEGGKYYGFAGLAEALAAFDAFCAQIDADKENADAYIGLVIGLKNLTAVANYAQIKSIIDLASPYYELLSNDVADYVNEIASIRDADVLYTKNKQIVLLAEDNAKKFCEQVDLAAVTVDLETRLGYLRAAQARSLELYDGIEGVADVIAEFEDLKAAYLADASAMNTVAEQEGMKLVQIAFANLKTVTTTKVAFIVKKIYEL